MKIDVIKLDDADVVLAFHNIGSLPPSSVDDYTKKLMPDFTDIFGPDRFFLFPVREGDTWEFIIIKSTKSKD